MTEAITPYNFVPLPERILPAEPEALEPVFDRYVEGRHTGWFDVEYKTLTPLYIRGAIPLDPECSPIATVRNGEQVADFFHRWEKVDGKDCLPVLPGSSLRGMIRSVFEIITESRMEFVNDHRLSFRLFAARLSDLQEYHARQFAAERDLIAGILHKGRRPDGSPRWFLRVSNAPAERGFVAVPVHNGGLDPPLLGKRGNNLLNGTRKVEVRLSGEATLIPSRKFHFSQWIMPSLTVSRAFRVASGKGRPGTLILPGKDIKDRKWYHVILTPQGSDYTDYDVPDSVYKTYAEWRKVAHGNETKSASVARSAPRLLREGQPAFALRETESDNMVRAIGANLMMPLPYPFTIGDALRYMPADDGRIDMAQALFGWVAPQRTTAEPKAIKSRVFFEDAVCQSETWHLDSPDPVRVPAELLTPKPTSFQIYLEQDETQRSVFDRKDEHGKIRRDHKKPLTHWGDDNACLSGFKRYWHRPSGAAQTQLGTESAAIRLLQAKQPDRIINDIASTQTRICPLHDEVTFKGRIRFENLTDRELGALYASIELPWNESENVCLAHRFGMGKNLGLGSIRLQVKNTVLLNMSARHQSLFRTGNRLAGERSQSETDRILADGYRNFLKATGNQQGLWVCKSRMKAFASLLSFYPNLGATLTGQIDIDSPMANQWRDRLCLPFADQVFDNFVVRDVVQQ